MISPKCMIASFVWEVECRDSGQGVDGREWDLEQVAGGMRWVS